MPSTGTASPGLTASRAPLRTSASGTSRSVPVLEEPRRLRREVQQLADRGGRLAPRARLEVTAEEHQRQDHADRLVVDVPHPAGAGRHRVGKERRGDREDEGGGRSDRDERVHVGGPVRERADRARQKRGAGPEVDREREGEQHPVASREMQLGHRDDDDRQRQRGGDERAPQDGLRLPPGGGVRTRRSRPRRSRRERRTRSRGPPRSGSANRDPGRGPRPAPCPG